MAGELIRFATLSREQAQQKFQAGAPSFESEPKSKIERELRDIGIARVNIGIDTDEFQQLSDKYAVCIEEHGDLLDWTAGNFDKHGVPEDGHLSKDIDFNNAGMQIEDPKNLFHFNNALWARWSLEQPSSMSADFRDFMDHGFQLHSDLTKAARRLITILDRSYVGMSELFFPSRMASTTLRLLRYDGYYIHNEKGERIVENGAQVAKPHYDKGGMTIQAYSSAPGFWIRPQGADIHDYERIHPLYGKDQSQMFFGEGFRAVYGTHTPILPLYHGVDRIFDETLDYVSPRTAAILFTDTPFVKLGITSLETQPERVDKENLGI